jgi:hypothetical protein
MPMLNSRMPDDWIARMTAANPTQVTPTGNIRLSPGRLSWINLFRPGKPQKRDDGSEKEGTYNVQYWFAPGCEAGVGGILVPKWQAKMASDCQGYEPDALYNPFRDQKAQKKYGATPGLPFITCSTQQKPQVVDSAGNPIVDEKRVYPGVWAIISVNVYSFGFKPKAQPIKGVKFGLQSVMIIADDEALGATAPPASQDFAGVQVDQTFDPAGAVFARPPGAPPPGPSILPAATPIAGAPAGWVPGGQVQGWAAPASAPAVQGYVPAAAPAPLDALPAVWTPPAPAAPAPPAAPSMQDIW